MKQKKKEIRFFYLKKRKEINIKLKKKFEKIIFQFFVNSYFIKFQIFHFFLPIKKKNEVNTLLLINYLLGLKKVIIVPKIRNNNMEHYYFTSSTQLKNNQLGIPEPINGTLFSFLSSIEVIFIPLLICDEKGNRIGYGKGYYDQFLLNLKNNTLKIGINFFECIEHVPKEHHDISLDYLLSPNGIKKFKY